MGNEILIRNFEDKKENLISELEKYVNVQSSHVSLNQPEFNIDQVLFNGQKLNKNKKNYQPKDKNALMKNLIEVYYQIVKKELLNFFIKIIYANFQIGESVKPDMIS